MFSSTIASRQLKATSSSLLAMTAVFAMPALAQNSAVPATNGVVDSAHANGADVGEIVVTAQRREEKARDVPISLTAITGDALGRGDVQQLSGIAKLTPGLRFDNFGSFLQPTIRGVGTALATSGSGSNVGIYVDGFYSPNPLSNDFELLNVSSVTVLKGPQGTLFGRNTTGGAIQVTTSEPSFETHGVAELSYGRFDAKKVQAYATTGLTDKVAIAISGVWRKGDGFVTNIVTGRKGAPYENWSVRTEAKAELSDTVSVIFRYVHADSDDPTQAVFTAFSQNGVPLSVGVQRGGVVASARGEVSGTSPQGASSTVDAYQLTGKFDLGFAELRSYSQFRKEKASLLQDTDTSSLPVFASETNVRDKIFTQELILTSKNSGPLTWTAGGFFFQDKNRWPAIKISSNGAPPSLFIMAQTDTRSLAAYGDLTYSFDEKFFVTAGLRYSNDQVTNGGFFRGPAAGGGGFVSIPSINDNRVEPRVVLRYKPSQASSVYASFSTSHKAGILNATGLSTVSINPEKIKAYEVGYKYSQSGVSFSAAAFYYDYKDLQVANYLGAFAQISNAASSRVYGAEAQLSYAVTRQFLINASAGYTNGRYQRFPGAPSYVQCLNAATCGASFGLFAVVPINAAGFTMARTPKFTGNIGAQYEFEAAGGKLELSGNLSYTSKVYFDPVQQFSQAGYELLSLRAQWTDPSKRFTFAVFGDNVTDSKYYHQVLPGPQAIRAVYGTPATWGVSARINL